MQQTSRGIPNWLHQASPEFPVETIHTWNISKPGGGGGRRGEKACYTSLLARFGWSTWLGPNISREFYLPLNPKTSCWKEKNGYPANLISTYSSCYICDPDILKWVSFLTPTPFFLISKPWDMLDPLPRTLYILSSLHLAKFCSCFGSLSLLPYHLVLLLSGPLSRCTVTMCLLICSHLG